jgi:hypothetical protein
MSFQVPKLYSARQTFTLLGMALFSFCSLAADSPWQQARIVEVKNSVDTRTTAWIVNTPIQDEETVCVIRVHLKDKILQGVYTLDKSQPPPPTEWVKHAPVRAQVVGDRLFLKGPNGHDYKLRVVGTKSAPMLDPWSQKEVTAEKTAAMTQEATHSMIGFDDTPAAAPEKTTAVPTAPPAEATQPSAPEVPTGVVSVSSVPYLAEVFVDGESMGYTPAKLKLAPGKHSFRCEKAGYKPWTKDITVTAGSELTLDATLNR